MKHARTTKSLARLLALGVAAVVLGGCGGGSSSPTEVRGGGGLTLIAATVSVDGTVYNGGTYHSGAGHGTSTRFEARLQVHDGSPAAGEQVWVQYRHGGGAMGGGRFPLYDDGTHGDHLPGDGLYCLDDQAGAYGFHHAAHHGEYHYEFWGQHHDGYHSNHLEVTVRVVD